MSGSSPEKGQQVGDSPGVMQSQAVFLVADPAFWVDLGVPRHFQDSSAVPGAIPSLTGWLSCSTSVPHLEKLWLREGGCTVTWKQQICFVGS